jgi:hypothetical protein
MPPQQGQPQGEAGMSADGNLSANGNPLMSNLAPTPPTQGVL